MSESDLGYGYSGSKSSKTRMVSITSLMQGMNVVDHVSLYSAVHDESHLEFLLIIWR